MSFYDALSLLGSLLLIVLILVATYYATRWYARRMRGGQGRHIKVLERVPMGQRSSLAIVKVGEAYYLIGAGEKTVELLCELRDFDENFSENALRQELVMPKTFGDFLEKAKDRLSKKDNDSGAK